ncbi:MAG: histidine phosphatase family protein [Pseudomonadota bacterium]
MKIMLVRHGQSVWNAERRLQGQADIELSALGREQAKKLAGTVQALQPDRVVASDLKRTRQTANLLGFGDHDTARALREIDVGIWTGQRISDLIDADADAYRGWRAGTSTPPDGESWAAFKQRTSDAVLAIGRTSVERVLLVAHGAVIRALLESFLNLRPERIVPVSPASLTVLQYGQEVGDTRVRLEVFNYAVGGPVFDAPD